MKPSKDTITITAMQRPELFRDMLVSLVACDLRHWQIRIALEPSEGQEAFSQICETLLPRESYTLTVNTELLGVRENPRRAIGRAFEEGAEFNLCLEEDFLLAPDALRLAEWYKANHRDNWTCLNLLAGTCGSAGNLSDPSLPKNVFETRCFNSIGVGFTRSDWTRISHCFAPRKKNFLTRSNIIDHGWDWAIYVFLLQNPDLCAIQPVAARCTHTGAHGVHCRPSFQQRAFDRLSLAEPARGQPPDTEFQLTDIDTLPFPVAAHLYSQRDAADLRADLLAERKIRLRRG